ncbi:MAG: RDD family protein [Acidimicrobiales bacterium]
MHPAGNTAVIGRRIGALLLDGMLAAVVVVSLGVAIADRTDYIGAQRDHDCALRVDGTGERRLYCSAFEFHDGVTDEEGTYHILDPAPALAIVLGVGFTVFVLVPLLLGATLGQRATGIRVVRRDGSRPGLAPLTVRWLLLAVDGAFTLGICGITAVLITEGNRRVGDVAAGTLVVRKDRGAPVTATAADRSAR